MTSIIFLADAYARNPHIDPPISTTNSPPITDKQNTNRKRIYRLMVAPELRADLSKMADSLED